MTNLIRMCVCVVALSLVSAVGPALRAQTVPASQPVQPAPTAERNVASFANFTAAVAAVAPTGGTLVVSTTQTLTTDQIIPAGVALRFDAGGSFNASAPVTLTIKAAFAAERRQIFARGVTVKFDTTYPEVVYPEWWGARGDGTTDDLAAFQAMTAALQAARPARVLLGAKSYYLSGQWDVDATMTLEGAGSGSGYLSPHLKFAPNTAGVVVHDLSTRTGKQDGRLARSSTIRNLSILGQPGPATHKVTLAGLTLTRIAGPAFSDAGGYHEGNTISVQNAAGSAYDYMIDAFVDADHVKLKPARVMVIASNNSPTLYNGLQSSNSYWSQYWTGQTINFAGQTYIIAAVDPSAVAPVGSYGSLTLTKPVSGLTHNAFNNKVALIEATVSGATANAPTSARPNLYPGLDARTTLKIDSVRVEGFAGNCLNLDSSAGPTAFPGTQPNTNLAQIERSAFYSCLGNGVYTRGVNSNQMHFEANDATNNHGAGFFEGSFLGNHYYTNHASFDFWGGFVATQNGVNLSAYYSDYTEGGMPASVLNQHSIFISGDHGAGVAGAGGAIQHLSGWTILDSLKVNNSNGQSDKVLGVFFGGVTAQPNTLFGFGAAEDAGNIVAGGTPTRLDRYAYQFGYNQLAPGWYSLYKGNTGGIGTNYAVDQPGSVLAFSAAQAAEGPGKLWLYRGIDFIGPARDVGLARTAANTLQVTNGANGAGHLSAATLSATNIYSPLKTDQFAAALTLDFAQGNVHTVTLTGDVQRLALVNLKAGGEYTVRLVQGGARTFTVAWGAAVKWAGGSAPRLSTGAGAVDIFRFISPDGAGLEEVSRALDVR